MAGQTVKIDGLDELLAAFDELPNAVGKGVLRKISLRALAPFVESVKAKAPVDADPAHTPKRPPGTLRDSYHAGTKLNKRQARLARKEGKSYVEVYAGTNDPAGIQTEFGNSHQAAQPHARPAWDGTQGEALAICATEAGAEIAAAARRVAKRRAKAGG